MTADLFLFVFATIVTAGALASFLWRRLAAEATGPWERAASVAVLTFAITIAINWSLSWLGRIDRFPLLITAIALAIPSAVYLWRQKVFSSAQHQVPGSAVAYLVPLIFWVVFVLWRGAIVPVLNHDALSYHMPKAVMLARAHHYDFFAAPDSRIPTSPANYELLVADVLLLTGSDALTEWIGTAAYLALLLLAAALAERWWGSGPHIIVTILLTAAIPVILLHSGAHKNDLISNVFYLGTFLWAGRWLSTGENAPLILALTSLAAGGGTKLHAVFCAVAWAVVFVWLLIRRRIRVPWNQLRIVLLSAPIALLLFGGWAYVLNIMHTGQVALPASSTNDAGYGDWRNLWEVPLIMLWRPFDLESEGVAEQSDDQTSATARARGRTPSPDAHTSVFIPWRGERWYWPRFELYFSHYGALTTFLVVLLPFAVRRYVRRYGSTQILNERIYTSIIALLAFLLMLPVRLRPLGFFGGFPRYFCFIAIFVLAWTVAPFLVELRSRNRMMGVHAISVAAALLLTVGAAHSAVVDRFQPLHYVMEMAATPGSREPHFSKYRAGIIGDRLAGPTDTIAVQSGFDSWIYPLYGSTLQRKLVFIRPGDVIPAEAKYVVIDRAWNIIWGHPRFEHMGQYTRYLGQGHPSREDLAVLRDLWKRPSEYELVYYHPRGLQAVFRRR